MPEGGGCVIIKTLFDLGSDDASAAQYLEFSVSAPEQDRSSIGREGAALSFTKVGYTYPVFAKGRQSRRHIARG
jgi:hypothetical protein